VQDNVSVAEWLMPPAQVPILVQVLVCVPEDGQAEGETEYVQLLSVQVAVSGV
jgi:hypothetical protein